MLHGKITFCTREPVTLAVAIPETMKEMEWGLQSYTKLGMREGMLFVSKKWPEEEKIPLWMAKVRVPLSMLWISNTGHVVRIEEHVQVGDRRTYSEKASGVIEVNADLPSRYGIRLGTSVVLGAS